MSNLKFSSHNSHRKLDSGILDLDKDTSNAQLQIGDLSPISPSGSDDKDKLAITTSNNQINV